jgi:hypothetical protein
MTNVKSLGDTSQQMSSHEYFLYSHLFKRNLNILFVERYEMGGRLRAFKCNPRISVNDALAM